jgi:hypothetical protein
MSLFSSKPKTELVGRTGESRPRFEYIILAALTEDGLVKKVTAKIEDGFRPTGGVALGATNTPRQAMVRENLPHPDLLVEA